MDNDGKTALSEAERGGHEEIRQAIVNKHASCLPIIGERYRFHPDYAQLVGYACYQPEYLQRVENFAVLRPGIEGSVRWLNPVDIRNADISSTIALEEEGTRGTITVTPAGLPPGHPLLSTPVEITLRAHDLVQPAQLEHDLMSMCSRRPGIRYIGYDRNTRVWSCRVDRLLDLA
jgi:hypothetical protein